MYDYKLPPDSPLASRIGLFDGRDFRLTTGHCRDCAAIPAAMWYFRDELIAAPLPGLPVAGFGRHVTFTQDLRQWAAARPADAALELPPLVWIASPRVLHAARLSGDGRFLETNADRLSFALAPKAPLNRSYYDATSTAFLAARRLKVRGEARDGAFIARTIWPEDFRLDSSAVLQRVDASPIALRGLVRAEPRGGAQSPFAATVLWERSPGEARNWEDAAVLAAVLNGAQGDDDEAHAGHFALITGRVGPDGAIGDCLANNFYSLDLESEKAIIASMLPLDNYLADLNSGQSWYRPSYLIVAILRDDRTARTIQGALERTYNQLYRHQLVYRHAAMNCASISVDVLRALGWRLPELGATSATAAWLGFPWFALRNRSLAKATQSFDYLTGDRTRLLPAVAFEQMGAELLQMAGGTLPRVPSPIETMLAADLEAVCFLSIPQLPSSRAWGDYPVATAWEYDARWPRDPAKQQLIPVPPRPFPDQFRDPDLIPVPPLRSERALALWAALSVVGIPWLLRRWWRRAQAAGASTS
jgi:hypothetical protein